VRVLLFGVYGEMNGARERHVALPAGSRVADVVESLRETPGLELPEQPVVAVNQAYASLDLQLSEEDEVAFIPPVAGG
jgi:molybdopterin converting factor subunit 1